jgi:tape measure domain-containing protein
MLRQAIGDTATYAAEIAKLNIALRGITKTSEEYADAQRAISLISNTLNVPIKEATAGFTKLSASVIGAGGNVNDAQIVMLGFTQAIKATSGGAKEVSGVMTALTQIFSKGKISAEEINQIAERLPGAFTAIAKAVGKTGPELQDALKNGEVGLNDLMKTAQYLTDQYGASANKMAASAEESGARMTVALDKLKLAIGETYQPIGSEFQESITNATNIAILAMESHKKNTEDLGKTISKTFGEETAKNIGDWFQRFNLSVAASVLGLQPLLNAINAINNYMGTQKTGQQKMIDAGSPNMYSDAQGNVYDAITGQLIMKAPTKFELPKSEGDDAAKKEAKLKQQRKLQQELNEIELYYSQQELTKLKFLQQAQFELAALDKDANIEAKKKLQFNVINLEYALDLLKINKQDNMELVRSKTIEDDVLQFRTQQGIENRTQAELDKLRLTFNTKRKAIEQGVTLELKKQTEELEKQADEYKEILRSVQQSLDQPLVALGQDMIRIATQQLILRPILQGIGGLFGGGGRAAWVWHGFNNTGPWVREYSCV